MKPTPSARLDKNDIHRLAQALAQASLTRRIEHPLVPRLLRHARRVAQASAGQSTTDDLVSEMVVVLLEKSEQFDGQTAAYIIQHCRWHANHQAEAGRTHHRYCPAMPIITDDDGNDIELAELIPDPSAFLPEDLLIERQEQAERADLLQRASARLGKSGRRILVGLAANLSPSALAAAHGVSRPAISAGLKSIRRAVAYARLQQPLPELG